MRVSLARLADTAREEIPSTMAAILRLSGMEISDLTLELSDLRFGIVIKDARLSANLLHLVALKIAYGINKSAQAVQVTEAGIRQIGSIARQQTVSLIEERANFSVLPLKPMVAGAARKTSHIVDQAKRTFTSIIS
ncbi:uncharacterized protein LOC122054695 [Zingiber officinale]|uniref:uncharacterized protein LOC122054695 n=1 Tax=Zingiber officinale TaxID=94328 RepID=UPI001C4C927A|nr:uncharacterized protein LOC122054695 [Zingiber officinale]